MTLTDLLLIYIITTQIVWLISFIVWAIDPLKPIREPLLVIALFISTPPVVIIMGIGHLIGKLADIHKNKRKESTPDTHEVRQDDETGLALYSVNEYTVGDIVLVDYKQYCVLDILPPKNGVRGYRVKPVE